MKWPRGALLLKRGKRRYLCAGTCRPLVSDVAEATRTRIEDAKDGTEGISTLEGR
jgi:hypothetical protein